MPCTFRLAGTRWPKGLAYEGKESNFGTFASASKRPIRRENGQVLTGKGP